MSGRFLKLLDDAASNDTIDQRAIDEKTYPKNNPRNALIDNTLANAANAIDPSGKTDQLLNLLRLSQADVNDAQVANREREERMMRGELNEEDFNALLDQAQMVPALGMTRAVKELGPVVGKTMNELASKIKDASPQAEHIRNLQKIRDFVSKEYPPLDKGGFKDVYDSGNKVIKKFRPEEYGADELLPAAIQEQAYLNKLKDITPKTKSYKAGDSIYQVQDKITPFVKSTKDYDVMKDNNRIMQDMLTSRGVDGALADVHPDNYGLDKAGNLKSFDVGTFQNLKTLPPEQLKELEETFKMVPSNKTDFLNELFKLKMGK